MDNDSWILPYAEKLVNVINSRGDVAVICRAHNEVRDGMIAFYLGCIKITPPEVLKKNSYNLVVHESGLPKGKGFAPLTWQILEGRNTIPVCLIEAADQVDSGKIYLRKDLKFEGHELNDEIRRAQGKITIDLCLDFLACKVAPSGVSQVGKASVYKRRVPSDSELDINRSIAEQFNLLRVVDNQNYPAFFHINGVKYFIRVDKENE